MGSRDAGNAPCLPGEGGLLITVLREIPRRGSRAPATLASRVWAQTGRSPCDFPTTKSDCVAQADLELPIFLPQPPEYRDHRCVPERLAVTLTQKKQLYPAELPTEPGILPVNFPGRLNPHSMTHPVARSGSHHSHSCQSLRGCSFLSEYT